MKKRIDVRLLAAAGLCMALLAVPPLAVQVQAAQYAAPQTRPALPGVMSDEIRLDPVAGALYRYGVQGGINRADSTWTENAYTTLRGKLKQAAARGLLNRGQLDYLLARIEEGEAHDDDTVMENGSMMVYCYAASYTGGIQAVRFRRMTVQDYTPQKDGSTFTPTDMTSLELMYLPDNGAFLEVAVNDAQLPAGDATPAEQTQAFLDQLGTTLAGSWTQAAADTGLEYRHTSGVLRVMRFAPDGNAFALTTMLEPEVYGGLDTLNGITTGPDGTVSTLGGDYVLF